MLVGFVETSLFVDVRSVGTWLLHHQIIDQQNVGIYIFWWQMFFNSNIYIALHGAAINFLIWTSYLFFFFRHFYLSTRILSLLTIESSAIHWLTSLTNLFLSFGLFLVLLWMLWMLVTVHNRCNVPQASQKTTWTIFSKRLFSASKEWLRSWSHTFVITYDEKLTKRKKKKGKNAKLFAFNTNAIKTQTTVS